MKNISNDKHYQETGIDEKGIEIDMDQLKYTTNENKVHKSINNRFNHGSTRLR